MGDQRCSDVMNESNIIQSCKCQIENGSILDDMHVGGNINAQTIPSAEAAPDIHTSVMLKLGTYFETLLIVGGHGVSLHLHHGDVSDVFLYM